MKQEQKVEPLSKPKEEVILPSFDKGKGASKPQSAGKLPALSNDKKGQLRGNSALDSILGDNKLTDENDFEE